MSRDGSKELPASVGNDSEPTITPREVMSDKNTPFELMMQSFRSLDAKGYIPPANTLALRSSNNTIALSAVPPGQGSGSLRKATRTRQERIAAKA